MADICVLYLSEDEDLVARLVKLLSTRWDTWWAHDIAHGNWERIVRAEIERSTAIVGVLSQHGDSERLDVIADEMRFAKGKRKPLFPFLLEPVELPFGLGSENRTNAYSFAGDPDDSGFRALERKLTKTIGRGAAPFDPAKRPTSLVVRGKELRLPAFVFSLSSHETQVSPREGATLLSLLKPDAMLVSSYDAWRHYRRDRKFRATLRSVRGSSAVFFLDCGNYEAYRKRDLFHTKQNPKGWSREAFLATAMDQPPDIAFAFDKIAPKGTVDQVLSRLVRDYRADDRALSGRDFPLCPIIHVPRDSGEEVGAVAARLVSTVARELDPLMVAVPERELGDGLLRRVKTVRAIRSSLNLLGRYYPLHLLGTGNPLTMIALAAAGADSFDGLEWCRTVADYDRGYLFHFQQFDLFDHAQRERVDDLAAKQILADPTASYTARVLSFNVDYFKTSTRTLQAMLQAGQTRPLLSVIPNIGRDIFEALST